MQPNASPLDGMSLSLEKIGAFRGNQQVFMDISLRIAPNEFIGILGPSGSGKSTLIEILALSGQLSEGTVLFDEQKSIVKERREYARAIGYVPQDNTLWPTLTVRENLWYAARLRLPEASREELDDAVDGMLRRFGLEEHRDKKTAKLSGGQKKRVSIAMELFRRPRLLILDEPTSGLDPAMERSLMEDLRQIADAGTTVVCSTHVMESIDLFDRVAVIGKKRSGRDSSYGDLDFYETPVLLRDYYGAANFAELYSLLQEDPYIIYVREQSPKRSAPAALVDGLYRSVGEAFAMTRLSPGEARKQISDVFFKSLVVFRRDRFLPILCLLLPPLLGSLVVLSQQRESNIRPLLFFPVVIVLWFGMNNSVRSIVGERAQFVRDSLAGLSARAFLFGKAAFYLLLGFVQVGLLWSTVAWGTDNSDFEKVPSLFFLVLLAAYVCGLGLGLLVSTLSRTENVAIAWVPLLIMPQLLLSSVAAGNSADDLADPGRIGPIAYVRRETPENAGLERFKTLSLLCFSRPALGVLEFPIRNIRDERAVRMEWFHFLALGTVTWTAAGLFFALNRVRWRGRRDLSH